MRLVYSSVDPIIAVQKRKAMSQWMKWSGPSANERVWIYNKVRVPRVQLVQTSLASSFYLVWTGEFLVRRGTRFSRTCLLFGQTLLLSVFWSVWLCFSVKGVLCLCHSMLMFHLLNWFVLSLSLSLYSLSLVCACLISMNFMGREIVICIWFNAY